MSPNRPPRHRIALLLNLHLTWVLNLQLLVGSHFQPRAAKRVRPFLVAKRMHRYETSDRDRESGACCVGGWLGILHERIGRSSLMSQT